MIEKNIYINNNQYHMSRVKILGFITRTCIHFIFEESKFIYNETIVIEKWYNPQKIICMSDKKGKFNVILRNRTLNWQKQHNRYFEMSLYRRILRIACISKASKRTSAGKNGEGKKCDE